MALSNVLMLSQITGHLVALVLSVCVFIPLIMHISKFNNNCMLFANGEWSVSNGYYQIHSTSLGFCTFPIVTALLVSLVSLLQVYRYARLVWKKEETTFLGLFLDVVFGTILLLFTIISAFFITLGFISWCSDMTQRFPSCDRAVGQNFTQEELRIDTNGFYVEMGTAQFGIWGAFAACVVICVVAYLKLINDHQMRNMKVSMYLERQRLVYEDANKESLADTLNSPPSSPSISTHETEGVS